MEEVQVTNEMMAAGRKAVERQGWNYAAIYRAMDAAREHWPTDLTVCKQIGNVRIYPRLIEHPGGEHTLTPQQIIVLRTLLKAGEGNYIPRDRLLDALYSGVKYPPSDPDKVLSALIAYIRKKLKGSNVTMPCAYKIGICLQVEGERK